MKIAHISDLHLLSLDGLRPQRLVGKRFTGWVNLRFRRKAIHKREIAQAVAREVAAQQPDHVVITGDLTNLALESEFDLVRNFLQHDLGLRPDAVSIIPGNHDAYTRGSQRSRRFQCYLGEYITSDLPGAAGIAGLDRFPFVRLRGPVAIIGLSSAVPRPPMVASGFLGRAQRAALHAMLAHREVRSRTPVILQHHPFHNPVDPWKRRMNGLEDAEAEALVLGGVERGLLLHGHLHRRVHRRIPTKLGAIDAVGTTSASLIHDDPNRMGGFNIYEIADDGGIDALRSYRLDRDRSGFVETPIPTA